jgi:large subunit ribosomal protein L35
MPKLKNHKGMAKRIKLSGTGKLMRRKAFRGHLLAGKQASRKRSSKNVKKMLGTYK